MKKSLMLSCNLHLTVMADANANNGMEYGALISLHAAYGGTPSPTTGSFSNSTSGVVEDSCHLLKIPSLINTADHHP